MRSSISILVFLAVTVFSEENRCFLSKPNRKFLNETLHTADIVASATVKDVILNNKDGSFEFISLKIRRVFKGKEYISARKEIKIHDPQQQCSLRISLFDTRVFSIAVTGDQYFLAGPVLPINLAVLDSLHSFVLGLPHKKRRKPKQTKCESHLCPLGSKCVPSTGVCMCRTTCRAFSSPVCGSDHVTYASECHLHIRSCLLKTKGKKKLLKIKHRGHCEKKNPCLDLRCGPGEDCIVAERDGLLTAECHCPKSCPNYGDSVESSPVCSSDGVDYSSICHLKQHACQTARNITLKYYGMCDPCRGHSCPHGTSCYLNQYRKPECRCSEQCTLNLDPVCATDGKTYANECVMNVSGCKIRRPLSIFKKGKCNEIRNPCSSLSCSHSSFCSIDANGVAACQCNSDCAPVMRPVCSTDGTTYENECELKKVACEEKRRLAVKHEGSCGLGVCSGFNQCVHPQVCQDVNGIPKCSCPNCTDELREVCASDGRTYSNECKMRRNACLTGKKLFVQYNGICEGCSSLDCNFYSFCVANGRGKGECQCPNDCAMTNRTDAKAVCGTDGVTYSSDCHLRKSSCQQKKFIVVSFEGKCDACIHVECRYGEECRGGVCVCSYNCPLNPPAQHRVCGQNGVLYPSECHLQLASCQRGSPIPIVDMAKCHSITSFEAWPGCSSSSCRHGAICPKFPTSYTLVPWPISVCSCHQQSCPASLSYPICGSDAIIYISQCILNIVSCRDQRDIYTMPTMEYCTPNYDSCQCNRVGSYGPTCEQTGQCKCRPGVGGVKCDHCLQNFWGIHLIANGAHSCQPCGCSVFGSARSDCEQTTGRCECHNGAIGDKCDKCESDMVMTPNGCIKKEGYRTPGTCSSFKCHHGAMCQPSSSEVAIPDCICPERCDFSHWGIAMNMTVCGSDDVTYEDVCQLTRFACKHQLDLVVKSLGICENESFEIDDRRRERQNRKTGIGRPCVVNEDCNELNAICTAYPHLPGVCKCGPGTIEAQNKCVATVIQKEKGVEIEMDGSKQFLANIPEAQPLNSNVTVNFTLNSSYGVILQLKSSELDESLLLRVENRRILFEFGFDSIRSTDYLQLNRPYSVVLSWKKSLVSLKIGENRANGKFDEIKKILTAKKKLPEITQMWIGGDGTQQSGSPFSGSLTSLQLNNKSIDLTQTHLVNSETSHPFLSPLTFNSSGFVEIPAEKLSIRENLEIEIHIKPNRSNGLILFYGSTYQNHSSGDFVAILLHEIQIYAFWDLGSGITYVKTHPISTHFWSTVVFERELRIGRIYVNGEKIAEQEAKGLDQHLDINGTSLFVGGVPDLSHLPEKLRKLPERYGGSVLSLRVNEEPIDLRKAIHHGSVLPYSWNCRPETCASKHSKCYEKNDATACRGITYPAASFTSGAEFAYLNSANESHSSTERANFSFEFRSSRQNGTIWYEGTWRKSEAKEHFRIFLENGSLKSSLNFGRDPEFPTVIIAEDLKTGEWYTVKVKRNLRRVTITVTGRLPKIIIASPGDNTLDTNGLVYLDGRLDPLHPQFSGCLRNVVLNGIQLNLLHDTVTQQSPDICHQ